MKVFHLVKKWKNFIILLLILIFIGIYVLASIKCFGVLSQEEVPNSVKAIHRITEFLWVMCAANKYSSANHHEKKNKKTTDS